MPDIDALFADYASYHQTKGNKTFHRLGIPLIMLTLIGMLARVPLLTTNNGTRIDAAMLLIAIATIYYLVVEWRLAIAMLAVSIAFYFLGRAMPLWLNVALFVLGWIFQFIGHSVYEHKNPAFFRNFLHLLVGPLWILNDLIPVVKPKRA
ncbi:MAG TPA: Mpo1-like protein [Thermoanaerobaculia bacterium]|nr:Mpo1-like protein [Thermoanaerobaculia bacterium]